MQVVEVPAARKVRRKTTKVADFTESCSKLMRPKLALVKPVALEEKL
jgi:hypothetical protein